MRLVQGSKRLWGVEMADIYAEERGRRSVAVEFLDCFWWAVFGFLGGFVPRKSFVSAVCFAFLDVVVGLASWAVVGVCVLCWLLGLWLL
ncbi:hypothetical protein Q3G72_000490 [Acer saccharum]|nr:hypothetical protein Q3G72_000490 [Acer saccharum]